MGTMTRRGFLAGALAAGAAALPGCATTGRAEQLRALERAERVGDRSRMPHIVVLLADDMGWGDPRCFNPESAIPTPHMDRLAAEGMRLTDCHSAGAVCTPSRYGLLTGEYHWRLGLERMGLDGYSANIVDTRRETVASMLRKRGYFTACIGKWHLGMGTAEPADYSQRLHPNPTTFGFDYYFGIPASLDMAPYVYMENGRTLDAPTERIEGTPYGSARFYREGAMAPGFRHEDVLPALAGRAAEVIDAHGSAGTSEPLFLYAAFASPHTPWMPTGDANGKSGAGLYGDFVWQTDAAIGTVREALERNGMLDDTLFIVSSDNGGLQSWLPAEYPHRVNGPWRGEKGDAYEGGHRVPFIARWPKRIAAGSESGAMACLTDLFATFAAITGEAPPAVDEETGLTVARDSLSFAPVLFESAAGAREDFAILSVQRLPAVRQGDWKWIGGLGGGGLRWRAEENRPAPGGPAGQLYNLADDPGETTNLAAAMPEKAAELAALMGAIRGR